MAEMWGCFDPLGHQLGSTQCLGAGAQRDASSWRGRGGFWGSLALQSSAMLQGFHIAPKHRDRAQQRANHPANAAASRADAGQFPYLCRFCRAAGNSQIKRSVLIHTCRHLGAIPKLSKSLNIPYVYSLEFVDLA